MSLNRNIGRKARPLIPNALVIPNFARVKELLKNNKTQADAEYAPSFCV